MYWIMSEDTVVLKWVRRLLVTGFVVGWLFAYNGINWFSISWHSPVTYLFVHGNIVHFIINIIAFTRLGCVMADIYGETKVVGLFFVTGSLAGVISSLIYSNMAGMEGAQIVGCSGAIFGWLGYMVHDIKNLHHADKVLTMQNILLINIGLVLNPNAIIIHAAGFVIGFAINAITTARTA